jgi:hypothetical protein
MRFPWLIGWFCALAGCAYFGVGLAALWTGRRFEATDGLLFGGLALVAGCVVLHRRARRAQELRDEEPHVEP